MKLKSYFAESVEAAVGQARRELGADAMLVNSQRTSVEFRHLGEYEVVCAVLPAAKTGDGLRVEDKGGASNSSGLERLSQEITGLRRQMERLAFSVARSSAAVAGVASNPALAKIFATLAAAELDANLAVEIVHGMGTQPSLELLRSGLGKLLNTDPVLGIPDAGRRVVAIAGPPGSGKSACIAKLAARFGLAARRPCHILAIDGHHVAGCEQLRAYAAILGVGFEDVGTITALAQALEELRNKDLILIDTPGLSGSEIQEAGDLAAFFAGHPAIDTHLVLPVSMRSADLERVAEAYEIYSPRKLLFTKLDETTTFGPIVNLSARLGKPVSFFSRGQQVPEDLEPASVDAIVELILGASCGRSVLEAVAAA